MPNLLSMSIGPQKLEGELCLVDPTCGVVVFAHGSGSSRRSRRNMQVAEALQRRGLSTLLFDLLTDDEADNRANVFNIPLLAQRVMDAIDDLSCRSGQPIGLFGASTGAAAALVAAARRPQAVRAVVSRGGRPDLAGNALNQVLAPTLLIVGGADTEVLAMTCSPRPPAGREAPRDRAARQASLRGSGCPGACGQAGRRMVPGAPSPQLRRLTMLIAKAETDSDCRRSTAYANVPT